MFKKKNIVYKLINAFPVIQFPNKLFMIRNSLKSFLKKYSCAKQEQQKILGSI